nr:collagen alpha-1(III) chain-like [Aotus nancymaae]
MATAVAAAKTARAAANGGNCSFNPLPGGGSTRLRWLPPGPVARDGRAAILEERRPRLPATAGARGRGGGFSAVGSALAGRTPGLGAWANLGPLGVRRDHGTGTPAEPTHAPAAPAHPPPPTRAGRPWGGERMAEASASNDGAADLTALGGQGGRFPVEEVPSRICLAPRRPKSSLGVRLSSAI